MKQSTLSLRITALEKIALASNCWKTLRAVLSRPKTARPSSSETTARAISHGDQGRLAVGYASDEMTAHGFRAMASTLRNESGKWNPTPSNAHLVTMTPTKSAPRTIVVPIGKERVAMAQWWSEYLDELRDGATPA